MRPGLEGDRGKRPNVPWLHKTAYYGNEDLFEMQMGSKNLSGPVQEVEQEVELSPMQAAEKLASTFAMPDLATLKHPSKKDVTAVKVWEVMPDYQTWANDYTEIVFDHDPIQHDGAHPDQHAVTDFAAMQRGLVADRDLVPDHQGMTARVVVAGVGDVQHRVILNV